MANKKNESKKNPLIGKEVYVLTITNDYCKVETFTSVFTSFQKALNAVKVEFREKGLMEYWDEAKKELKEQFFYHNPILFNDDRFIIECVKIF